MSEKKAKRKRKKREREREIITYHSICPQREKESTNKIEKKGIAYARRDFHSSFFSELQRRETTTTSKITGIQISIIIFMI